ncbi:MAG: toxin-antitoxin system YwqK family antitoxin [Bacteroidia bacterium]
MRRVAWGLGVLVVLAVAGVWSTQSWLRPRPPAHFLAYVPKDAVFFLRTAQLTTFLRFWESFPYRLYYEDSLGWGSYMALLRQWDALIHKEPTLSSLRGGALLVSFHLHGKKWVPFFLLEAPVLAQKGDWRSWLTQLQKLYPHAWVLEEMHGYTLLRLRSTPILYVTPVSDKILFCADPQLLLQALKGKTTLLDTTLWDFFPSSPPLGKYVEIGILQGERLTQALALPLPESQVRVRLTLPLEDPKKEWTLQGVCKGCREGKALPFQGELLPPSTQWLLQLSTLSVDSCLQPPYLYAGLDEKVLLTRYSCGLPSSLRFYRQLPWQKTAHSYEAYIGEWRISSTRWSCVQTFMDAYLARSSLLESPFFTTFLPATPAEAFLYVDLQSSWEKSFWNLSLVAYFKPFQTLWLEKRGELLTLQLFPRDTTTVQKAVPTPVVVLSDSVSDGPWVLYHPNGRVHKKGFFFEGQLEGEYWEYYATGTLKVHGYYEQGKKAGKWQYYTPEGKLWREEDWGGDPILLSP